MDVALGWVLAGELAVLGLGVWVLAGLVLWLLMMVGRGETWKDDERR